jgi:hypothetical protein
MVQAEGEKLWEGAIKLFDPVGTMRRMDSSSYG